MEADAPQHTHVALTLLIAGVVLFLLYQKPILALFTQLTTAAPDDDGAAPPPTPPPAEKAPAYKDVKGRVIFQGGGNEETWCCSCSHGTFEQIPKDQRVGNDKCKVGVDPCKLVNVTTIADAQPKCHNVDSLCDDKIVPTTNTGDQGGKNCVIKELCGWGCGGFQTNERKHYLQSVTLPEGIQMAVLEHGDCTGRANHNFVCDGTQPHCRWDRQRFQGGDGMEFGVAPGYQLKCGTTLVQGAPPP